MIVADTNVIVYLLIPGLQTAAAERLFSKDPDWIAPRVWLSEFRNAVAVLWRAGAIGTSEARGYVLDAEERMRGRDHEVLATLVWECIERSKLSAYDCEFVALARQLDVPLVTADRRIVAAFPSLARPLI